MMTKAHRARSERERRRLHKAMLAAQHTIIATHRAEDLERWRRDHATLIELTRQPAFRDWFEAEELGAWRDDYEIDPDRFRLEMDKVMAWLNAHPGVRLAWL